MTLHLNKAIKWNKDEIQYRAFDTTLTRLFFFHFVVRDIQCIW